MRAVGYIRVSTEYQVEKGNSLEAQQEAIRDYAEKKGWNLINTYQDGGLSASTSARPAYQQMIRDLKHDKFDIVIVTKIDRLSRNIRDFVFFLDLIEQYNKSFVSVTQNFDTSTPMGRLTLNILASFAQFEREILSERVREILFKKAAKGNQWMGGAPPMGYKLIDKKLVVREDEVPLVQDIFKTYIVTHSTYQTADILTARGYRYRGKPIAPATVQRVIENRLYIGDFVWGKRKMFNGKVINKQKKDWVIVPNVIPPIIDKETFAHANRILITNKERNLRVSKSLLGGILYCKKCGSKLYRAPSGPYKTKSGEKRRNYYRCSGIKQGICNAPSVEEQTLDSIVIESLKTISNDKTILEEISQKMHDSKQDEKELITLKKQKEKLEKQLAKLLDFYLEDIITKDILLEKTNAINAQLRDIEDRMFEIEDSSSSTEFIQPLFEQIKEAIKRNEVTPGIIKEIFSFIAIDTASKEIVLSFRKKGNIYDMERATTFTEIEGWQIAVNL